MDQVLTDPVPSYEQVRKLNYIRMILDESLRLWPTAPQFGLFAKEDTVIGGKYAVKKGETVAVILPKLHRDKEAWGRTPNNSGRSGSKIRKNTPRCL